MIEITNESFERFEKRFPNSMSLPDIAAELDQMDAQDSEEFEAILCSELLDSLCYNYLKYSPATIEIITGSDLYKLFKRHARRLSKHALYDALFAFMEGKRTAVKKYIHEYIQNLAKATPRYGESDVAFALLLTFKNAYEGFWPNVKREIESIQHDEIAAILCDVIDAFYNAPSNEDAVTVLESAYQQYPESPTINEMLGIAYYDEKQYGNSIAAFERLYDEETDSYDAKLFTQDMICFYLGIANDKMKDRKAAISYYEKAVEIYPQCPYAANNLGYAYYRDHQYEKAYSILKRCLDENLEEDFIYPVTNYARVLYAMGRYKDAKEFLKTAPTRIPKAVREKIEKAPNKNTNQKTAPKTDEMTEEQSQPVVKATIERKGTQFQSERVLEDELTMRIEAGLNVFGFPLKIYKRKGEYGRQYIFPKGRLDILAEDDEGNLYIIELKKDSGYGDAYKQTVEYIEWFKKNKAKGKKVFGIICLNSPGQALIEAVRKDNRIKLFEYQISYNEIV